MELKSSIPLQIVNLSKSFPGVQALTEVSINAYGGEVLGLVGVNGAGKSTLMNVLGGIVQPDSGGIIIDGKEVKIKDPRVAEDLGIAFIQQEIQVFNNLRVFENIFITDLHKWRKFKLLPFNDVKKLKVEAKKYLDMLGCNINPNIKVGRLSTGEQQMVQIARALSQGGKILLFDEPTSSLSAKEKNTLFEIVRKLRESNIVIIYITHYLDEIFELSDRVVILKDGKVVKQGDIKEIVKKDMITNMIGSELIEHKEIRRAGDMQKTLSVENLVAEKFPDGISFTLAKGEILGVWGLLGSGRTELIRSVLGLDKIKKGRIFYSEQEDELKAIHPIKLLKKVGYITERRHYDGLFLDMTLWQNITSVFLKKFATNFLCILTKNKEQNAAKDSMSKMNVKAPNEMILASQLSGGNQQKVVMAKWFIKEPKILFMDEPTRGVDVGAKNEIQRMIFNMANAGKSFVVVSSELEEIMHLSSRIIVLHKGQIVAEIAKDEFSKDRLMNAAGGEA